MLPMQFVMSRGADVWEANTYLTTYPRFKKLKDKYGDHDAGEALYAIYLVYDPSSPRRENGNLDFDALLKEVGRDVIQDTALTWTILRPVIKDFQAELISQPEKLLEKMHKRLARLHDVMEAWHPDKDDAGAYAAAAEKAEKMEERYLAMYTKVEGLRTAGKVLQDTRGGGGLSFLEKLGK